jgi:hypothetical protein
LSTVTRLFQQTLELSPADKLRLAADLAKSDQPGMADLAKGIARLAIQEFVLAQRGTV